MKTKIPKHCKGCVLHWTGGVADGKHNNWCCKYGRPARAIVNHCRLHGGKREAGL